MTVQSIAGATGGVVLVVIVVIVVIGGLMRLVGTALADQEFDEEPEQEGFPL